MKTVQERRRYFFKKLGITFVIPIFLMVIGSMMMLVPLWGTMSEAMTYSSLIFYNPNIKVKETSFMINDQTMYRPLIGEQFANLKIDAVSLEVPVLQGEGNAELRKGAGHYVLSLLPGEGGERCLIRVS